MRGAHAPRGRTRPGGLDLGASDVVACEDEVFAVRGAIHGDCMAMGGDLRWGLIAGLLVVVPAGAAHAGPGPSEPTPVASGGAPVEPSLGATEEARPAVAAPTAERAEPLSRGGASSPGPAGDRWIQRHRPQRMTAEFGVAVGVLIPPPDHELYDYKQIWNIHRPAAASIVFRAGFYPLVGSNVSEPNTKNLRPRRAQRTRQTRQEAIRTRHGAQRPDLAGGNVCPSVSAPSPAP